jgi:DNA-binding NarL/FixJ family response regulator
MPIRLVIAEDHYLVREGIRRLLETQPDLEVAAVCGDLDSLLAAVKEEKPDVVITDIRMPPGGSDEGIRAAEQLRTTHPSVGVLVLSAYAEPAYALRLLEGGSSGRAYLLKDRIADIDQLLDAIHAVASGDSVIDPRVVETLVATQATRKTSRLDKLTPRELEVLGEIAQGKNNAAIAGALFLSERAVEKHINAIFAKLGLSREQDTNRRVRAALLYLDERATSP